MCDPVGEIGLDLDLYQPLVPQAEKHHNLRQLARILWTNMIKAKSKPKDQYLNKYPGSRETVMIELDRDYKLINVASGGF